MSAIYKVEFGQVFEGMKRTDVGEKEQSKTVAAKDAEDAIRKVRKAMAREWVFDCDAEGNYTKDKLYCADIVVGGVERVGDLDLT